MKTLRFNALKMLNEQRQQRIYRSMHKNASTPYESVGWISKERQNLRFEKLVAGITDRDSILDFGCGLGALFEYLRESNIECKYTGIDIVPEFIKKSKKSYTHGNFSVASIFDITDSFDYVVSSGVYAFYKKDVFFESVQKCFLLSNKEYRFNILIDASGDGYLKINRRELENFVLKISPGASFEYGYLENDITVSMPKL